MIGSVEQSVLLPIVAFKLTKPDAQRIDPFKDSSLAIRASLLRFMNLGATVADNIPSITITTTSSISVNP